MPDADRKYIFDDATVTRVVDGDTIEATIRVDVGFRNRVLMDVRFRLLGINAPATTGLTRARGLASAHRLAQLCEGQAVTIESHKTEKYGRWLATVTVDGVNVNDAMIAEGFAVPYDGTGPRELHD